MPPSSNVAARSVAVAEWRPSEMGLGRAGVLGGALVAGLAAGLAWIARPPAVPPPDEPAAVHLADLSDTWPAPVPAQSSAPPVETAPPPLASLPDLPSEIAVAQAPEPVAPLAPEPVAPPARPVPQVVRPAVPRHEAVPHRTAAPEAAIPDAREVAPVAPRPSPAPAVDTTSGLGPYQAGLHRQIERNMLADRSVSRLGVGGTALIVATIAPDGRLLAAHIARSSGVRAIDLAALGAVERGGFTPFGEHMPAGPISISVPISVEAD